MLHLILKSHFEFRCKGYNNLMVIERDISQILEELSQKYPVITITGPRQSGKTTITQKFFKGYEYINLENPRVELQAKEDPEKFLSKFDKGVIIDEIQKVPELTSYIQVICDERKQEGMFILTGSQNFSLIESVSQSLAGRSAILELLPLSFREIMKSPYRQRYKTESSGKNIQIKINDEKLKLDKLMLTGFYPRIYDKDIHHEDFYIDYIKTYIERDLRDMKQIQNLSLFRKFMSMCASRIGQPLNLTNISNDLGVSYPTLKDWLHLLGASYLIFLLEPFNENINKQLTKSPKLYFTDTGLACFLLNINTTEELAVHPLRGNLFENLVVIEFLKNKLHEHKAINLSFFKDKYAEVDLLIKEANKFLLYEIKSAETFTEDFLQGLDYFEKLFPSRVQQRSIIYGGSESYSIKNTKVTNLETLVTS